MNESISIGVRMAVVYITTIACCGPVLAQSCSPDGGKIIRPMGASERDYFGGAVAISGDTAVVGAHSVDVVGFDSGAVYVYEFKGSFVLSETMLVPSDATRCADFGLSVSISGDRILVGTHSEDNGTNSGSAYIFKRTETGWAEEVKLTASDGSDNDRFGDSVSIHNDFAVIGAPLFTPGYAYVFRYNGSEWIEEAKLAASPGSGTSFGSAVCVQNGVIAVGSYRGSVAGVDSGAVHVFRHDGSSWVEDAVLVPDDSEEDDRFGCSVSISEDSLLIGACEDDDRGFNAGSAYIYTYNGIDWIESAKLLPDHGTSGGGFGRSVAFDGGVALVGAPGDDGGSASEGAAYVFSDYGATWVNESKLRPHYWRAGDVFGSSLSMSQGRSFIGAPGDRENGPFSGSGYLFDLSCLPLCIPDANNNGVLEPSDFTAWVAAYNAGDPKCDQNSDGSCTPSDFTAWIANFNAGC